MSRRKPISEIPEPRPLWYPERSRKRRSERLRLAQASNSRELVVVAGPSKLAHGVLRKRNGTRRVLFVAHREEILRQSRDESRMAMPGCDAGLFTGDERFPTLISYSDQSNPWVATCTGLLSEHFDVVIVDDPSHAAARTYRSVIEHFAESSFWV